MLQSLQSLATKLMSNNKVGSLVEFLIPVISILILVSGGNSKWVIALMLVDLIIKFARKGL